MHFAGNAFLGNLKSIPLPQELSGRYKSDGSVGQGNWAEIPWVAIFDESISATAQQGYYIVFLFSADMRKMYLSLNQGYTLYSEEYPASVARNKIKRLADYWKGELIIPSSFEKSEISLESTRDLARGYENGNICSKCYYVDNFPAREKLHEDIGQLIEVFKELKSKLIVDFKETNSLILSNSASDLEEIKKEAMVSFEGCIGNETLAPIFSKHQKTKGKSRPVKNRDYDKEHRENRIKGNLGEMAILEIERQKLLRSEDAAIRQRAEEIEHTSKAIGDGVGYDIKSFDENDGRAIYIEVKTTSQGENSEFYFTDAELRVSKEKGDRYYIYRIYDFKPKNKIIDFYKLQGPLEDKMTLTPYTYKVRLGGRRP
ncbi:MAG: DUF3578 domain-containing protein [Defluviitaleaceae bacterium]|nr:DUF3578 domain-containing protein [Defluviitaleaceae bacterium]